MTIGRRLFIGLAFGCGAALHPLRALAALIGPTGGEPYPLTALRPYLDTLIPRDDAASATDIGVDEHLRHLARLDSGYIRLLQYGCKWLDDRAKTLGAADFASLDPARRETVVAQAAAAPEGSSLRAFFDQTRDDAMEAYYSDPRNWPAIGFRGPPQPDGYPDFAGPPA